MFKRALLLLLFLAQPAAISIASPQPGDVLRGRVEVVGKMDLPNFDSAELAFSYADSADAPAWFTIQTFSQPAQESIIAVWDTTLLTDGDYTLHLRVFLEDGSSQDVIVSDLKIRNDEPLPVGSPTATLPALLATPLPTSTLPPDPSLPTFSSPTPLPANPAAVTSSSIYSNFARGALLTLVLFAFFSLILRLRKN